MMLLNEIFNPLDLPNHTDNVQFNERTYIAAT